MSLAAPRAGRVWYPVGAAMFMSLAVAAGGAVLPRPGRIAVDPPADAPARPIAAPGVQPEWKMKIDRAATRAARPGRAVLVAERDAVEAALRDVYDALFLEPDRLPAVLAERFSVAAAEALSDTGVGWPPEVSQVRIRSRSALLGVRLDDGKHAAALVEIRAAGVLEGAPVRIWHRSTVWLEKKKGRWRVIAFEVTQKPLR